MKNKYSFAILSGGNAKRFGSDKTKAIFKGIPIYEYSLDIAETVSDDILFISKNSEKYLPHRSGVRYLEDILPNQCPLSGIVTAMKYSKYENIFIISADMPLVSSHIVDIILSADEVEKSDITTPLIDGKVYTLSAVYKKIQYEAFLRSYNEGRYKLYELVKNFDVHYINEEKFLSAGVDLKRFLNINFKEDLMKADDIS